MKKFLLILVLFVSSIALYSQEVPEHISNTEIYSFLDELATLKFISINTVVKPYSRIFISEKLLEAKEKETKLNKRQKAELEFYLKNFRLEIGNNKKVKKDFDVYRKDSSLSLSLIPLGISYKDKLFTLSVKPICGFNYYYNQNGGVMHRWWGAEAYTYIGKHFSAYASLRDNSLNKIIIGPNYLTQTSGVPYKNEQDTRGGIDYSEMRGGLILSWKWGSIGLIKDHIEWGTNYNGSNIFSGRTPSFAHLRFQIKPVKWFEFNYIHGWLVSEVIDSNRSYNYGGVYGGGSREVMREKNLAANMFTIRLWKNLAISFGNSIVYSDIGTQAVYLTPFFFFKSIDHTYNSTSNLAGQNSQMFFDVSSHQIKHLHLYTSLFVDEIGLGRMFDEKTQSNFISWKIGFGLYDFPLQNFSLFFEYTRTNPYTYQHWLPATTFESNSYSLGHYLRDNAQEYYASMLYRGIKGLSISPYFVFAQKGNKYEYGKDQPWGQSFMKNITWQNLTLGLKLKYQFLYNCYFSFEYQYSDIKGFNIDGKEPSFYLDINTPKYFQGTNHTIIGGFNFGF